MRRGRAYGASPVAAAALAVVATWGSTQNALGASGATALDQEIVGSARADSLVEHGNRLYMDGQYAGAVSAYEAVLAMGVENGHLHYNLGNAYFKASELGRAILSWERARVHMPGDPDVAANLELARTLTADAVEPMPAFWLFAALNWWVRLLPDGWLVVVVTLGWMAASGGVVALVLARRSSVRRVGRWLMGLGLTSVILFGSSFLARELRWGQPTRAVILAEAVPVRSAPRADDDLTLFNVHEGTTVRVDGRTDAWVEVVLEDGKVGWVPADVLEEV